MNFFMTIDYVEWCSMYMWRDGQTVKITTHCKDRQQFHNKLSSKLESTELNKGWYISLMFTKSVATVKMLLLEGATYKPWLDKTIFILLQIYRTLSTKLWIYIFISAMLVTHVNWSARHWKSLLNDFSAKLTRIFLKHVEGQCYLHAYFYEATLSSFPHCSHSDCSKMVTIFTLVKCHQCFFSKRNNMKAYKNIII